MGRGRGGRKAGGAAAGGHHAAASKAGPAKASPPGPSARAQAEAHRAAKGTTDQRAAAAERKATGRLNKAAVDLRKVIHRDGKLNPHMTADDHAASRRLHAKTERLSRGIGRIQQAARDARRAAAKALSKNPS